MFLTHGVDILCIYHGDGVRITGSVSSRQISCYGASGSLYGNFYRYAGLFGVSLSDVFHLRLDLSLGIVDGDSCCASVRSCFGSLAGTVACGLRTTSNHHCCCHAGCHCECQKTFLVFHEYPPLCYLHFLIHEKNDFYSSNFLACSVCCDNT